MQKKEEGEKKEQENEERELEIERQQRGTTHERTNRDHNEIGFRLARFQEAFIKSAILVFLFDLSSSRILLEFPSFFLSCDTVLFKEFTDDIYIYFSIDDFIVKIPFNEIIVEVHNSDVN